MVEVAPDRYLERIGLAPDDLEGTDRESLARLQSAHLASVPFETLSITGDPYGEYDGEPIVLEADRLVEKIVERERGGFCYELNGAFAWLLDALGYDVRRCSARVAQDDGGYGIPADHLALVVDLDRRYLVDVGVGAPVVRTPVPLEGTTIETPVGTEWRVETADRPDADFSLRYRDPREEDPAWTDRYILEDEPRALSFFEASCEYHQSAPESPFPGEPVAMAVTERGHVSLSPRSITWQVGDTREKRSIDPGEYADLLAQDIGVRLGGR